MRAPFLRYLPVLLLVVLVIAAQLLLSGMKSEFYLTQLTMSAYYAMVTLGLCLLMGYAGQVSLGHAGFFALGGYATAVLSTLGVIPWLSIPAAIALTGVVAFLVGIPVLRLRGHYLAMATLAFGFIVSRVLLGSSLFGAADGISDIPGFRLFAGLVISGKKALRVQNYYIAWTLVALGLLVAVNLVGSRVGKALRAIHGNEEAASAMGVDVARYKLAVFVLSAVFAAVGGSCLAHFNGGIGPGESSVLKSVRYVALVAAGGMGNLGGTLAVSVVLTFLSLRGAFGLYDDAVFAAILVAIMLFAPDGLLRPLGALLGRAARIRGNTAARIRGNTAARIRGDTAARIRGNTAARGRGGPA